MTWTRFDDNWFVKMEALGLNVTEIGYLAGLIQYCSRSNTYDGHLTAFKARCVTEVDDPDAILAHLHDTGRILWDGKTCVVLHLDDHLPPPHMREGTRKESERDKKRRQRAHAKGDHQYCPESCPGTVPGGQAGDMDGEGQECPEPVPAGPGTGQDGPGLEGLPRPRTSGTGQASPSSAPPPGGVDLATGEVLPSCKPCVICRSTTGDCSCFDDPEPAATVTLSSGERVAYSTGLEPSGWA